MASPVAVRYIQMTLILALRSESTVTSLGGPGGPSADRHHGACGRACGLARAARGGADARAAHHRDRVLAPHHDALARRAHFFRVS